MRNSFPRLSHMSTGSRPRWPRNSENENGKPERLSDEDAIRAILDSDFFEPEGHVDEGDPLKLQKRQLVEIWPVDSGFNHHDKGELVSIGVNEVVIESKPEVGDGVLRIHYPRTNIRISPPARWVEIVIKKVRGGGWDVTTERLMDAYNTMKSLRKTFSGRDINC